MAGEADLKPAWAKIGAVVAGPLWADMNKRPRRRVEDLSRADLPVGPGV